MFPRGVVWCGVVRSAASIGSERAPQLRGFNDTERRLRGITVGYSSARVTFQTSHERSRDIPRGPGAFVPIWRHIIPESGQTDPSFPTGRPVFVADFACSLLAGHRLIIPLYLIAA